MVISLFPKKNVYHEWILSYYHFASSLNHSLFVLALSYSKEVNKCKVFLCIKIGLTVRRNKRDICHSTNAENPGINPDFFMEIMK
ncbi:MAG: hypothetical protein DRP86_03435 [Candidatus Neomarinimicrobiota bacterium]|nr:MAG: hypothetical protein DRP86_03435 [Candidatus Neomarinimicrobiota bacterium]